MRELPISEGWNVLDDNILATSNEHFAAVCEMLKHQAHRAEFTGGLEAARLTDWHIKKLWDLKPKQMFFAYDTPDDLEPLMDAGKRLQEAGWARALHKLRCFVLVGYPGDSMDAAIIRLRIAWEAGFLPSAMLWRDHDGKRDKEWARFQRLWIRPIVTKQLLKADL